MKIFVCIGFYGGFVEDGFDLVAAYPDKELAITHRCDPKLYLGGIEIEECEFYAPNSDPHQAS